jgi:hypothetical protein
MRAAIGGSFFIRLDTHKKKPADNGGLSKRISQKITSSLFLL